MNNNLRRNTNFSFKNVIKESSNSSEKIIRSNSLRDSSLGKTIISQANKSVTKGTSKNGTLAYEKLIKDLNIKLPSPKQKFQEFMMIAPFNRAQNHLELIGHFLKNVEFFKLHQLSLIKNFAKRVKLMNQDELDEKMMVILEEGECFYNKKLVRTGTLLTRHPFDKDLLSASPECKFITINMHEYLSYLVGFVQAQISQFGDFLNSIQTFKIFNQKTLQKFCQNLTIHYYLKGEILFEPGQQANLLYVVYSGKVSRKVIVQIDKINKIPTKNHSKILRVMSKSYEHQIQFEREDLIGVSEVIENIGYRKQLISVEENSILIGIERHAIQESLDDYIKDRLRKYNLKKYPLNYDQLCQNYLKQKNQMRKTEERKIAAMQSQLKVAQTEKRKQKISSIIKMYEQNIKLGQNKNLLFKKLSERRIKND